MKKYLQRVKIFKLESTREKREQRPCKKKKDAIKVQPSLTAGSSSFHTLSQGWKEKRSWKLEWVWSVISLAV